MKRSYSILTQSKHFKPFTDSKLTLLHCGKLALREPEYYIVFSPNSYHMSSGFLTIQVLLVFNDEKVVCNLFNETGIIGHSFKQHSLEVSSLIPSVEWPIIFSLYAKTVLRFVQNYANRILSGTGKNKTRLERWHNSVVAIAVGLEKMYKTKTVECNDEQMDVWIPIKENLQLGLVFAFGETRLTNGKQELNDGNFINIVMRYKTEEKWEYAKDDSNWGFEFPCLWLLEPEDAFEVFMANFEFVFKHYTQQFF